MSEAKGLVLKNYLLIPLIGFLARQELKSKQSRSRYRVIKLLSEKLDENEKIRFEMLNKYGEKDEMGNLKKENGNFILGDNQEKFNKEYDEFMQEDSIFNILPSNENDIEIVHQIIENTEEKFSSNSRPSFSQFEEFYQAFDLIK
jgi:hypothetical protein